MSRERPLRGSCSCGRNTYVIEVPPNTTEVAQVIFDRTNAHRRSQASPLSAWLRVPLSWYRSTTYAFFDDETHSSIRRVYTSPREQTAKRHFCGFCGTPLSFWSESPASEADYISLTLCSLASEDLRDLEDLGLLPAELVERTETQEGAKEAVGARSDGHQGLPWFEAMIEGSSLGMIKRTKATGQSADGRLRVEWEVTEWTGDGGEEDTFATGKRKLADVESGDAEDSVMDGLH